MPVKRNLTIGSDPEFAVVNKQYRMVEPYELFMERQKDFCDRGNECGHGCEKTNSNPFCWYNRVSQIGTDCGLGELRPAYGNSPKDHFRAIKALIDELKELPPGYRTIAGTVPKGNCAGGHVHIGGIEATDELSNYLSYYAGIPMKAIEREEDLLKRGLTRWHYGYFGKYSSKTYGNGSRGIEWRMPASWLIDPEMTMAHLSLAYVVAEEYQINPISIPMTGPIYRHCIIHPEGIIKEVEKMKGYAKYSKDIEPIFQLITNKEKWDCNKNFLEEW